MAPTSSASCRSTTYLGHIHIAGTQRYRALTPDLLREASLRFERYAMELQP